MDARALALLMREKDRLDAAYAEVELAFKMQHKDLIFRRDQCKKDIEALRAAFEIEAAAKWFQDGAKPEAPLGLQIRREPTIYNAELLCEWARENMPELLKLDEKATKAYVEHEAVRILSEDGEMLAAMETRPTLVAGAKTLISWLEELEWSENVAKEQETND